jgi:raffinose/stachyose/melibiose transport system substrate-binding protein
VTVDVEGANPGPTAALDQLYAEFMAMYPNVTIERVKTAYNDLVAKQPLDLSGPNPPDLTEIVADNKAFAEYGNQGLILKLDDYAAKYGWTERSGKAQLFNSTFDANGQIGTGSLYGVPQVQEVVGVFYNKEKLAKLGLEVPTTWEDFLASLDAAKTAGEIPMMLGNVEGWPAGHVYAIAYNRFVPTAQINGWTYHTDPSVSFDSAGFRDGSALLQKWGTGGYLTSDFNSVSYDDAWKRFTEGEGLYLPAGSWLTGGIQEAMGENGGLFLAPPSQENPALQVEGGPGQAWAIPAGSEHQDCAAALLDFMTSQRGGEILIANNVPPGFAMDGIPDLAAGAYRDLIEALQSVNREYQVSAYEGTATPTIGEVLRAGNAAVLAGRMTPEDFVKSVQAEYEKG